MRIQQKNPKSVNFELLLIDDQTSVLYCGHHTNHRLYVYLIMAHMCDKHITLCLKWQMALLHVFMQNNYSV
jgi:hypothetical protein